MKLITPLVLTKCRNQSYSNSKSLIVNNLQQFTINNLQPLNLKTIQSEDSLKISLTPKRLEFTGVQKLFLLWREIGDKSDHYISYRVFFQCEATKGAGD